MYEITYVSINTIHYILKMLLHQRFNTVNTYLQQ